MRYTRIILILIIPISLFSKKLEQHDDIETIIGKTQKQFEKASDYQVTMKIELKVPGFRMPKKKYKVYFKQPNKLKIKSRGFGMLPKTGIFTSPIDNFDNLKNMRIVHSTNNDNKVHIKGDVIVDSLKLKMPNEYAKLGFKPSVTVVIDTIKFNQGDITNTTNGGLEFIPTGQGYFKSDTTGGMVIPYGSEASRWPSPSIGDTRWNTDSNTLETWDGTQYVLSAGSGGTVSPEYMNELALQYTIILG